MKGCVFIRVPLLCAMHAPCECVHEGVRMSMADVVWWLVGCH